MNVRRHHVILSGAIIAIVLMVGFATSFIVDAASTNRTYDTLAADHVALSGRQLGCASVGSVGRYSATQALRVCRVAAEYKGQEIIWFAPYGQSRILYVDPHDPSIQMTQGTFGNGPTETTGDVVIAVTLIVGAACVATIHEVHRRRRHRRHRRPRPSSHIPPERISPHRAVH